MGKVYPNKASFSLFVITTSLTATSCNPPKDSVTMHGHEDDPLTLASLSRLLHLAFKGIFNVCKLQCFRLKSALKCYWRENEIDICTL